MRGYDLEEPSSAEAFDLLLPLSREGEKKKGKKERKRMAVENKRGEGGHDVLGRGS